LLRRSRTSMARNIGREYPPRMGAKRGAKRRTTLQWHHNLLKLHHFPWNDCSSRLVNFLIDRPDREGWITFERNSMLIQRPDTSACCEGQDIGASYFCVSIQGRTIQGRNQLDALSYALIDVAGFLGIWWRDGSESSVRVSHIERVWIGKLQSLGFSNDK
jgi:hypothetical protein